MEKVLISASVASMIGQFNLNNIQILQSLGYQVNVATNFVDGSTMSDSDVDILKKKLVASGVVIHQIDFPRGVGSFDANVRVLKQLNQLFKKNNFKFIHTHAPLASILVRFKAHKFKIPVIYTAHGFQFFKGSSFISWLIFYPLEKFFSRWTDTVITINEEDYKLAASKFTQTNVRYVPGVGIDIGKIRQTLPSEEIRSKFHIPNNSFQIISVGELNENKNHIEVVRALNSIKNSKIYYVICGIGSERNHLINEAEKGMGSDHLIFPGYIKNIISTIKDSDLFILPSKREGLSVALLEAAATDIPVIASDIRGNRDILERRNLAWVFSNKDELERLIKLQLQVSSDQQTIKSQRYNFEDFGIDNIERIMTDIYKRY